MPAIFRSLRGFNFRLWAAGAFVSNIGTWMQRTAQDWLVFAELTDRNATAVGIVMALQFGPPLLLLPLTGFVADHFDRRRVLMLTQTCMGLLALGLGLLTISGHAVLWQVHVFAFLLGCVTAFDAPARQTFVSDLVTEAELSNAVALNSTSFNGARLIGPAAAGLLISWVGSGWVFVINAVSFVAVIASLHLLRLAELQRHALAVRTRGSLLEGFRYVWNRPDLVAILSMLFLIATFGLNFPIFVSMMSVTVFHGGPGQYGVLISTMAVGSVTGALLSARRAQPRLAQLLVSAIAFSLSMLVAALMPNAVLFGLVLIVVGMSAQTFMTTSNSLVQLSTEPAMRGRVLAILLALALGGTPLGAPIVGWVADAFGARWSLGIGVVAGAAALLVGLRYLVRHRGLRIGFANGRLRIAIDQGRR